LTIGIAQPALRARGFFAHVGSSLLDPVQAED
jgi:hypothetical protein